MKTRSITSIYIAIVYVGTVLLSAYFNEVFPFFDLFVLIISVGASIEVCRAISKKFSPALDFFVILYVFLGYLAFFLLDKYFGFGIGIVGYMGMLAVMAGICYIYCCTSKKQSSVSGTSTLLAMVYPATLLGYMVALNHFPEFYRMSAILLVFIVTCLTDTFAYLVGSLIKGPKLCPKISPKKTISGAIGGLVGGIGGAMLVYVLAKYEIVGAQLIASSTLANVLHYLFLGLLGSVFTQVGDLVASYIKRKCEIKDYGHLLPGHGGVLDRIDGMMFNAVLIFIYMSILMA